MTATEHSEAVIERPKVRVLPDGRMSASDAATYLGLDGRTLANRRVQGKAPAYKKVGGRVFYMLDALTAFVEGKSA